MLGTFLKRAKKELLIYDPKISDKEMLRILQERAKAGVEIKVIGKVAGSVPFDVQKLGGTRLHTRTIIRDRRQAFVGSQSLRTAELDSRRELGLILQDAKAVKQLIDTFESDWTNTSAKKAPAASKEQEAQADEPAVASEKETEKAVQVFTKELDPLDDQREKGSEKSGGQSRRRRAPRQGRQGHDEEGRQEGGEGSRQGSGPGRPRGPGSPPSSVVHPR